MSKIMCPGYMPPGTGAEDDELLLTNFALILDNANRIIESSEMYFCTPLSCWLSAAYVAGGPLCLGFLLEGYRDETLLQPCSICQTPANIFRLGGSPLSGSNFSSVICLKCDEIFKIRHAPGFCQRLVYILHRRKEKAPLWQQTLGSELSLLTLVETLSKEQSL